MSSEKNKNYLQPAEFFRAVLVSIKAGKVTDELAEIFMVLSTNFVNHHNFVRYSQHREDLIATGVLVCVASYNKFRPNRNILEKDEDGNIISKTRVEWDGEIVDYHYTKHYNPHSYFTHIMENEFKDFLKREYAFTNVVNATKIDHGLEADEGYMQMLRDKEEKQSNENEQTVSETVKESPVNKASCIVW